jgi:hypothetical protein
MASSLFWKSANACANLTQFVGAERGAHFVSWQSKSEKEESDRYGEMAEWSKAHAC